MLRARLACALLALSLLGWTQDAPSSSPNESDATVVAIPGKTYYWDFDETGCSPWIDRSACSSISYSLIPDHNGSNTGAAVKLWEAATTSDVTTYCNALPNVAQVVERDGVTGITSGDDLTLTGAIGRRGARGVKPASRFVFLHVSAVAIDHSRFQLSCNGARS